MINSYKHGNNEQFRGNRNNGWFRGNLNNRNQRQQSTLTGIFENNSIYMEVVNVRYVARSPWKSNNNGAMGLHFSKN